MKKSHFSPKLMMAIFVAAVMILSALVIALPGMQGREYGMNPAVASSNNIQPNPTMNVNITWSSFNSSWGELEYYNGTAYDNLTAQQSSFYPNPISINTADLVSKGTLQNDKVAGKIWNNVTPTVSAIGSYGEVATAGNTTIGTVNEPFIRENTSKSGAVGATMGSLSTIPIADLPSNNLAYDYLTFGMSLSGQYTTGTSAVLIIYNGSTNQYLYTLTQITPGQSVYLSMSLAQIQNTLTGQHGLNITGNQKATEYYLEPQLSLPTSTTNYVYTLTITALALTEYPILLGQNATGGTPNSIIGTAHLSKFKPLEQMTIYNNSYSVAVSQPVQNLTTQQSAINTLSYIEQVEYQGQFNLPMAPDLSYGSANITEHFNVSTSQTQVLDINGVSYLSAISGKNNTVVLLSSLNPNGQTQFLQIVDYTQSQWTSISSPPGIFTLAGIEYYWEEFIIAVLAIVGVGAGAASRHASNLRKVK